MTITSPAFQDGGKVPVKYTCDGENVSPPLTWTAVPAGAQSLALIVDDPDAPSGVFVHWVAYGIGPASDGLQENASKTGMPEGARQGRNGAGRTGWMGPCPPSGTHHYVFHLYALNVPAELKAGAERNAVDEANRGHVLAEATLTGLYSRQK